MTQYTAQQAYALAQWLIANSQQFPQYYINSLGLRHLEYNALRGLPEASEKYFQKTFGKTIDQIWKEVEKRQADAAKPKYAAPTEAKQESPKRRVAVFIPCFNCQKDIAVPEDDPRALPQGDPKFVPEFCSEACMTATKSEHMAILNEVKKFVAHFNSIYYNCTHNTSLMEGFIKANKLKVTEENLILAFQKLQGQLLGYLTVDEIQAMHPEVYNQRAKLEGSDKTGIMGGIDLNTLKPRKHESVMFSSKNAYSEVIR